MEVHELLINQIDFCVQYLTLNHRLHQAESRKMILIFLHYVKNILQRRSCDHNLSCTANYNNELACIRTVSISYLVSKSSIVFKRTHRALKHTGFPISSKYVGTKVAAVTPPPFSYLPSINMNLLSQPGTELE